MRYEPLSLDEAPVLKELMYAALFVPPGSDPFPPSILNQPRIKSYYQDWGRRGDLGILAWKHQEVVGGVWCRLFDNDNPGYGFINDETPELVIAVHSQYRNMGVGTQLLESLQHIVSKEGFSSISLSVQKMNPALNLYKRMGFAIQQQDQDTCTMMANLRN